jgi:hypothetical protein
LEIELLEPVRDKGEVPLVGLLASSRAILSEREMTETKSDAKGISVYCTEGTESLPLNIETKDDESGIPSTLAVRMYEMRPKV